MGHFSEMLSKAFPYAGGGIQLHAFEVMSVYVNKLKSLRVRASLANGDAHAWEDGGGGSYSKRSLQWHASSLGVRRALRMTDASHSDIDQMNCNATTTAGRRVRLVKISRCTMLR